MALIPHKLIPHKLIPHKLIPHWADGARLDGTSSRTLDVTNPASGEVTAQVALAGGEDAERVIGSARAAAAAWAGTSIAVRTQVLFAFRELLNQRKEEVAAIITSEHGKVLADALGEVSRGLEVVEFACGIPHLLKGGYSEGVSTGVDVHSKRQPLGVVGIISPFNFPAMVPMWFFPVAIAAGKGHMGTMAGKFERADRSHHPERLALGVPRVDARWTRPRSSRP